ncbi:MAG TPA: MltA domain-containing protein [Humisphaera sp.]
MPSRITPIVALSLFAAVVLAGCRQDAPPPKPLDYAAELPPGQKALRKLEPANYPDFAAMNTDRAALVRAVDHSLTYLAHPSSRQFFPYLDITHERAVRSLQELRALAASPGAVDWNREVRARFDVYQSVGAPKADGAGYTGQVLFTGYFTPIYDASLTRTGPYQWPLYKRPRDLVTDNVGEGVYRRAGNAPAGGGPVPVEAGRYPTRAEIERGNLLAGQELVWLKTRWEAYVITVQGSARLRLTDGRIYEVGFAGTNGHDYASPGEQMIRDGVIAKPQLTLAGLRAYFEQHPEQMDRYLWVNPRMIFFTERPGGPYGSLNVPVTPGASIATDKAVFPRALPAYVVTTVRMFSPLHRNVTPSQAFGGEPTERVSFRGLMIDQDTGGAIRSAGRCDLYMGVGPEAEQAAGGQLFPGQLYYLVAK